MTTGILQLTEELTATGQQLESTHTDTHPQTDRQTDREMDKQTDRESDTSELLAIRILSRAIFGQR